MTRLRLIVRALGYYWRTNLAVVAGVATAVAVLSGALLVGDSVRGSLRDLVAARLGRTELTVTSPSFFREALAADLGATPIIAMPGVVTEQGSGKRASGVQVYGVDDRFWRFHGVAVSGPLDRDALVSEALANEIGASADRTILVRVERPSAIPIESLQGRKDDSGRTLRLTVRKVLDRGHMGEFSMRPQQGDVPAVFVPLSRLQQDLGQVRRVNALLTSGSTDRAQLTSSLRTHATLDDYGLRVRSLEDRNELAVESDSGFIDPRRADAIQHATVASDTLPHPVFSYLANTIRHGDRLVPYSLVTASDLELLGLPGKWMYEYDENRDSPFPILLNDWTARALDAKAGDRLTLEYYVWRDTGDLETSSHEFVVKLVIPLAGAAADRNLVPDYPGITGAASLSDWDPPFPIDLKRIRPADEDYWKQYRTAPKAFVPFIAGQKLWATRYGDRTSVRVLPGAQPLATAQSRFESALRSALDPLASGFVVRDARVEGLNAATGSTDFGEYFVYFSFFLVVSALVLAALFFRLGVEQRAREVGLLRAVGFSTARVRRLFLAEGIVLASIGGLVGIAGAVAYGALMMAGLRTWWSGAVGTTALTLHVSATSLVAGAAGAIVSAVICIWWTLRGFARLSERALLAGEVRSPQSSTTSSGRTFLAAAILFVVIAAGLVAAAGAKAIDPAGAFFGAGSAMLIACLLGLTWWLRSRVPAGLRGDLAVARLGARNTSERPGRSVLAVAVIASATFILIAVDAFRLGAVDPSDRRSGTGGFPLLVDLQLPLVHNPDSPDGREALGLPQGGDLSIEPFRVLPGEDTSCLNLYQPTRPRILGVGDRLIKAGRFSFQSVRADEAAADDAARANPWLLLERPLTGGAIPAIADANSLTYILHKSVGDEIVLQHGDAPVHLRLVAALSDSIFQGELLISDANFRALFPGQQGFRFLLVDAPAARMLEIANTIERTAADLGADSMPTAERLAAFHAVENTYLSTFQTLGGLGLLVGTIGLAAVLLRNVLERRKELALLRAVGYRASDVFTVVFAENVMLLVWGLAAGALSASIAVVPAAMERGARVPLTTAGALLVAAVLVAGLLSSALATYLAVRMPLVGALRSE